MNVIVKSAVAGVLALGASGAYALALPETGSSNLILVIQNTATPTNVYALDTNIPIDSVLPTSGLVSNAVLDKSIAGINASIAASPALQAFLAANPASGDAWTLESAQFKAAAAGTGPSNKATVTPGFAKSVFTSIGNASNIGNTPLPNFQGLLGGIQNSLSQPVDSVGLVALQTNKESTNVTFSAQDASKYQTFTPVSDLAPVGGTAVTLFGFTGNGDKVSTQTYILGSATLAANGTLTITGNGGGVTPPPVPLPAAVWLFGSGIMGLVGVSRRRKAAIAA